MRLLTGKAVSPGYARGTAVLYDRQGEARVPRYHISLAKVTSEQQRFEQAIERSHHELKEIERRVFAELGQSQSAIFSTHLGMLRDKRLVDNVKARIRRDLVNAEQSLDAELAELTSKLSSSEDAFLRERAHDILDVGQRVMRQLSRDNRSHGFQLPGNTVILARELLPSETVDLDREHVVAIVTEEGGENSHAAILARALGIPAVTGVARATEFIDPGSTLLVDGQMGHVTIAPTDADAIRFLEQKEKYDIEATDAVDAEKLECVTCDGTQVTLLANISRPHEARLVSVHHLSGVGLFRTEFMHMNSLTPPAMKRQHHEIRTTIERLGGLPLVIRTLDLGGDKVPAFLAPHHEANPNLGLRGLRFSLAHPELFQTQLRAIISAASAGSVRILLPLVLGGDDFSEGVEVVENIAHELGVTRPALGAMIETPSALFALDDILEKADFVSIGTNDLTQFMLAADRNAVELADDYSVLHPAVLRAIQHVVKACDRRGREITVCGEAAGFPRTACLLVGMGLRRLSMSPVRAAHVRSLLRSVHCSDVQQLADDALKCKSTNDVRRRLLEFGSDRLQATSSILPHSTATSAGPDGDAGGVN